MTTGSSHDGASRRASKIGNRKRTLRLASEIVLNDHIDIKGKPCRVLEAYTKRSLRYFYTIDILTGYIVWSIVPTSTKFVIPDVSTDIYQLIGISYKNHSVTLLHLSSDYTRNDIFLPEDRQLRNLMVNGFNDDKIVYVAVVSSLGKDAVYRVQVDDKTDSAISHVVANNAIRILKLNTTIVMTLVAVTLVTFVHTALGLFVLLASHALCCHNSMCCIMMASKRKESVDQKNEAESRQESLSVDLSEKSFVETQADIFSHRHGLLILHLLAALMFRIGTGQSFPWFADSALCVDVIFHGVLNSRSESSILRTFPSLLRHQLGPHHMYFLAGYCCFFSGLYLTPYKVFYAIAALGYISLALKISQGNKNDLRFRTKSRIHRN
ncbi:hypothetical protein F2Q69_00055872 [Brassica cretica]|uniref:Translation initiation factor 5A C-terminal domain-containing protein n=3 Tax=Brassica TaxID=3705 RepID=A0A0D3DB83_BRAOL|nr:hypothetical protein F2Q69_00055872 [Brassica cretica]VDD38589.1 unnamed protein product [Brassica oleracea]